ncbi:MAG: ATP-binding cassette domain-containing protein [Bacteroidales bacterium]
MSTPLIVAKDISVVQDEKIILQNISFSIHKNELVYLIGRVGSGKTSLIKTFYAELPLHSGQVMINEFELEKLSHKNIPFLRRTLGIVFQDFKLLTDRDVHENLKFVLEATNWKDQDAINLRIKEVLREVNLVEKEFSKPNELSGGEQQRVVVARAMLNKPNIILADEPTGNLDPESSAQVMKILQNIAQKGSGVLIATHQYNIIRQYPGRVLKIENNQLKEIRIEEIAN